MVYDIQPRLTNKACLVCYGSSIYPRGISIWAKIVKWFSVFLLDMIADSQILEILKYDVTNAFIQVYTKERIFTRYGPEFRYRVLNQSQNIAREW